MTDLLVVGYGNDLREDDGAGRRVAEAVEQLNLAGVTVQSASQLTPELALEIAGKERVVFVDASTEIDDLHCEPVRPRETDGHVMTHHGDPRSLLSLVSAVGEQPREAMLISIPAERLGLGIGLSERTTRAVDAAVELIVSMARE